MVPVGAAPCSHASEDRTLGQHVASRLVELGVTDFFCVPGVPHSNLLHSSTLTGTICLSISVLSGQFPCPLLQLEREPSGAGWACALLSCLHIFISAGDFNLVLLDQLIKEPQLRMRCTANELNAGYAADGYARERGVACVVVTYTGSRTIFLCAETTVEVNTIFGLLRAAARSVAVARPLSASRPSVPLTLKLPIDVRTHKAAVLANSGWPQRAECHRRRQQ